jgi:hypothetical protein
MPILLLLLGVATFAVVAANANTGYKKPPPQTFTLDNYMPPDLRNQVLAALTNESDPAKLDAFAAALAAQFPLSSSQLHAKAVSLRGVTPAFFPPANPGAPSQVFPADFPAAPSPVGSSPLDIGQLPEPTRSQVLQQLATGSDPAALEAFASQLDARSPAAANALRLRASMLRSLSSPFQAPSPAPPPAPSPVPHAADAGPSFVIPAPPAPPATTQPAPPAPFLSGLGLDPGMPPDLAQAVMTALARELDPAKLRGFASSIGSQFPVAAALLNAKANTLGLLVGPSPAAAPPAVSIPTAVTATSGTYTVLPGDFPIKIAQRLVHDGNRWPELVAANPLKKRAVDGNFATLLPGEVLQLPSSWGVPATFEAVSLPRVPMLPMMTEPMVGARAYVVQPGDFPIKIAQKIIHDGHRWPELIAANPSKKRAADGNFASLLPGERLLLPASWTAAPAPSAQTALLLNPGGTHVASA